MSSIVFAISNQVLILGGIFVLVVGIFVVVAILTGKKDDSSDRLGRYRSQHGDSVGEVALSKKKEKTLQKVMAEKVLKPLSRVAAVTGGAQTKLVERLVHAGIRRKGAAEMFLGAKVAMAVALPLAFAGFFLFRASQAGQPLGEITPSLIKFCPVGLLLGLILPNFWLGRKVKQRQENIRLTLPNALDLLVVCIESGLAIDAALVRVGREVRESAPDLSEELALLNLEISAGKPREDCLRNLGLRTGVDEVKALTARIIQAQKFGTNLAHSLRIHADSLREKRRQEAEERAAKTTVQLLFPLVFFIFPAIFVVILGPAAVNVMNSLGNF
ncbi:MAG: type II secretion system F family protein [Candidatus Brocadiia bacterium]